MNLIGLCDEKWNIMQINSFYVVLENLLDGFWLKKPGVPCPSIFGHFDITDHLVEWKESSTTWYIKFFVTWLYKMKPKKKKKPKPWVE